MIKKIPPEGGSVATDNYNSTYEQVQKAQQQMQADGLGIQNIPLDGKRIRFTAPNDKPKSNAAWLQGFVDINGVVVVHYGSWKTGQSSSFIGNRDNSKQLTPAERRALAK